MFKKIAALGAAAALCVGLMTGCSASGTTADTSYSAENPLVLTLAHGLSETHTVHIAMTQFAEEVAEKTDGRIQVKIFPNGQLGSIETVDPASVAAWRNGRFIFEDRPLAGTEDAVFSTCFATGRRLIVDDDEVVVGRRVDGDNQRFHYVAFRAATSALSHISAVSIGQRQSFNAGWRNSIID